MFELNYQHIRVDIGAFYVRMYRQIETFTSNIITSLLIDE